MASDWTIKRLGDLIELRGGLSYKGELTGKGSAILVGMGAVSHTDRFLRSGTRLYGGDFSESHRLVPGDLVIATRQQSDNLPILGCPAIVPLDLSGKDVVAATNLYKVTNLSSVSNGFIYWLLRGREYRSRILESSKGTTVRMITKDAVEDFFFKCPPLHERDAITEFLDGFDHRIDLLRRSNSTLESINQSLYKSWFVDFDPVIARAAGLAPKGMNSDTAMLFPAEFKDSDLGPIPLGWTQAKLSDAVAIRDGKPWLPENRVNTSNVKVFGANGPVGFASEALGGGRVVFLGKIGSCGALNSFNGEWWATNNVFYISQAQNRQLEWCRHLLMSIDFKGYVGGSSNPYMPLKNFGHHLVLVPPLEIRLKFEELAAMHRARIEANQKQADLLVQVRDTLLPRLVSGRLRLPDAQELVGDALA